MTPDKTIGTPNADMREENARLRAELETLKGRHENLRSRADEEVGKLRAEVGRLTANLEVAVKAKFLAEREVERLKALDERHLFGHWSSAGLALKDALSQVDELTSRLCHAICDCGPAYTTKISAHRGDCRFAMTIAVKPRQALFPDGSAKPDGQPGYVLDHNAGFDLS